LFTYIQKSQSAHTRLIFRIGLAAGVVACASIATASPKWDSFVGNEVRSHSHHTVSVIAKLNGTPQKGELAAIRQLGGRVTRKLDIVHSLCIDIPANKLTQLAGLKSIAHLSGDVQVKKNDLYTVDASFANVAYQQYGATGAGVTVAVLDSGIYPNPDLSSSRILDAVSMIPGLGPVDQCGHGTHVSGILAGNGAQSTGSHYTKTYLGIARDANVVSVRVLNQTGAGTVSNVISGVQWVVQNAATYHIRVINLSLGHTVGEPAADDPLDQAVEAAWKAGIVVVCAAGNDGRLDSFSLPLLPNGGYLTNYGSIECPGNDPEVITVGAMKSVNSNRADDEIATYSSRGPTMFDCTVKPDIVAPGNLIVSTLNSPTSWLAQTYGSQIALTNSTYISGGSGYSSNYAILSGTSMATPVVSGAVALLLQLNPTLSPDTVKIRLMTSADKWADPLGLGNPATYGAGYLDIPAAIQSSYVATGTAASPGLSQTPLGLVEFLLGPVLGTTNLSLTQIYGQRAMWGTDSVADSRAMWGTDTFGNNQTQNITVAGINLSSGSIVLTGE
jgi:serine protease AprX